MGIYFLIVVILIGIDQITKICAAVFLKGRAGIAWIPGVFELHYLENQSAAFGIDPVSLLHRAFEFSYFNENPEAFLTCKMIFFAILTVLVIGILIWIFYRIPNEKRFLGANVLLVLFVAGAIGNLIDRIWHHYVIDFFYFRLIDFPIFNVADIYVTISAVFLVILGLFYYKDEDYEVIFPPKKKD